MTDPADPNTPPQTEGRESEQLEGATSEVAPPPPAVARRDPYAAFRFPAYRLYVVSFVLAIIGSQTLSAASVFDVYQKTRSNLVVGLIGLANAVPLISLALPAGHIADTFNRKKVLIATQTVLVACPLVLAFWHTLPALFGLLVVNAVALTIGRPARASIMPNLVPSIVFPNAVTWNSSFFELASAVAPAITGFIIARYGPAAAYTVSGVAMGLCMVLTCFLPNIRPTGKREPMTRKTLVLGLKFVTSNKLILGAMLLDLIAVVLSGATALMPAFAERLAGDPATADFEDRKAIIFGWLMAAPSVGAMAMALFQAHMPPVARAGRVLLLAVAGYALATLVFGLSTWLWLSLVMLALTGVFDNVSVVIRHSLVQLTTPDSMRGRVSAVNQIFIISSNEVGKIESGLTAALVGPVLSVVGGAIATLGFVGWVALTFRPIRSLGRLSDVRPIDLPNDPPSPATVSLMTRS